MASFSNGTHHLHITNRFKKQSFHFLSSTHLSSLPYKSCFGSSLCKLRGSRTLGNELLARAEDKAKGSSSSPPPSYPSNEQQGQQLNIDKQLQVLFYVSFSLKSQFLWGPLYLFCYLVDWNFRFWHIMYVNLVLCEWSALGLLENEIYNFFPPRFCISYECVCLIY